MDLLVNIKDHLRPEIPPPEKKTYITKELII